MSFQQHLFHLTVRKLNFLSSTCVLYSLRNMALMKWRCCWKDQKSRLKNIWWMSCWNYFPLASRTHLHDYTESLTSYIIDNWNLVLTALRQYCSNLDRKRNARQNILDKCRVGLIKRNIVSDCIDFGVTEVRWLITWLNPLRVFIENVIWIAGFAGQAGPESEKESDQKYG